VAPRERLKEVFRQLSGIGGGRSLGFGPKRVRSLPDGVAQLLAEYLESKEAEEGEETTEEGGGNGFHYMNESAQTAAVEGVQAEQQSLFKIGDLCPECGQAAVVNEEGCRKCYSCGYSEC
jgi:ribonucleoside-diphosphate reductase alpha chain